MVRMITLHAQAGTFVEQRVAAGEAATAAVAEMRAQEAAYDRWFRDKVMKRIVEADAGEFATPEEVASTLQRWRSPAA